MFSEISNLATTKTGKDVATWAANVSSPRLRVRSVRKAGLWLLFISKFLIASSYIKKACYRLLEKIYEKTGESKFKDRVTGIKFTRVENPQYEFTDIRIATLEELAQKTRAQISAMKKEAIKNGEVTKTGTSVYWKVRI